MPCEPNMCETDFWRKFRQDEHCCFCLYAVAFPKVVLSNLFSLFLLLLSRVLYLSLSVLLMKSEVCTCDDSNTRNDVYYIFLLLIDCCYFCCLFCFVLFITITTVAAVFVLFFYTAQKFCVQFFVLILHLSTTRVYSFLHWFIFEYKFLLLFKMRQ